MADPRGRGFNRGNGRWHAPDNARRSVYLERAEVHRHGWITDRIGAGGHVVYVQAGVELTKNDAGEWITNDLLTGDKLTHAGQSVADVTATVLGGDMLAAPEVTAADYYGVSR